MVCNGRVRLIGVFLAMLSAQCLAADFFPTQVRRDAFLQGPGPAGPGLRRERSRCSARRTRRPATTRPSPAASSIAPAVRSATPWLCSTPATPTGSSGPSRSWTASSPCRTRTRTARPTASGRGSSKSRSTRCPRRTGTGPTSAARSFSRSRSTTWTVCPPICSRRSSDSILHAARSIVRRNVGPGYTNIALMGTYVTLVAGERFATPDLADYGQQRLRRFHDYTRRKGLVHANTTARPTRWWPSMRSPA